jgi:hypothetical protein
LPLLKSGLTFSRPKPTQILSSSHVPSTSLQAGFPAWPIFQKQVQNQKQVWCKTQANTLYRIQG